MAKGLFSTAKTYAKNAGIHFGRVITFREKPGDALKAMRRDARKVSYSITKGKTAVPGNRRAASKLLEDGRQAYNGGNYSKAEDYFRRAIIEDETYGWAHTYLGHALYKQSRLTEAVAAWRGAAEVDPESDAARKARKKIQHVERSNFRAAADADQRLRDY